MPVYDRDLGDARTMVTGGYWLQIPSWARIPGDEYSSYKSLFKGACGHLAKITQLKWRVIEIGGQDASH